MYKLASLLTLSLILGCSTVSSADKPQAKPGPDSLVQIRDAQKGVKPPKGAGFDLAEAMQTLEFCVELNNQDDRHDDGFMLDDAKKIGHKEFWANPGAWQIVFDSRDPDNHAWDVPLEGNAALDAQKNLKKDPANNGFGPFQNAWLLLKRENVESGQPPQYAIAIRGTISQQDSKLDDALVGSLSAQGGIEIPSTWLGDTSGASESRRLPITFAASPHAEIHQGFAYGAFTILFDKEKGIINRLKEVDNGKGLPSDSQIFITGHSQGAAIASLVHSFLYYAINDDRYGLNLKDKNIQLKSYVFAQPRPGNMEYAFDVARIAGNKGLAFTINNDLDMVPRVPITLQLKDIKRTACVDTARIGFLGRAKEFFFGLNDPEELKKAVATELCAFLNSRLDDSFRNHLAQTLKKVSLDKLDHHYTQEGKSGKEFLDLSIFRSMPEPEETQATSLNYATSGQLVPVFGIENGGEDCPKEPPTRQDPDALQQHHATCYRNLIKRQLE